MSENTPSQKVEDVLDETDKHAGRLPVSNDKIQELRREGLSYTAIGERLGISRSTAWRRLNVEEGGLDDQEDVDDLDDLDDSDDLGDLRAALADETPADDWNCAECGAALRWLQDQCEQCGTRLDWSAV